MCIKFVPFIVFFFFFNVKITLLIERAAMWEQESLGCPATFPPHGTDPEGIFLSVTALGGHAPSSRQCASAVTSARL